MTEHMIDAPRSVRDEESLDLDRLLPFLEAEIPDFAPPVTVSQFPSGYSNLTYCLRDANGLELVLRRPPFGANIKSGHDMAREYRILSALQGVLAEAPRPHTYSDDEAIIGAPFYVMERVRGVILRSQPRPPELTELEMQTACHALVDTFVRLHDVDVDGGSLSEIGQPDGYVERQVAGWSRRWDRARTDPVRGLDRAKEWLAEQLRDSGHVSLIHNDFKYDNVVYAPGDFSEIAAVLDWEMATIGDPLMDLGTSLAYWVEPDDHPIFHAILGVTALPGNLTRAEVAARYSSRRGIELTDEDLAFYFVFGLFKVAVIGQQIYFRFKKGHTRDPRFAGLIDLVRAIGNRALHTIETGEI